MIDDAGQEIELGMWNRLLEQREKLLAEVKRLREDLEYQEGLVRYIKSEILKVIE